MQRPNAKPETSDDTQETLNANPNTRLDSIEKGIDDVRSKIEMLEYRASLSKNKTNDLVVFGSNFFNSFQTTFSPINEQNISSEYILDVGDVLCAACKAVKLIVNLS